MIKNATVLILGSGQIGEACAIRLLQEKPKKIILHTLTEAEAKLAVDNVQKVDASKIVELIPSWGNALVTKELMLLNKDELNSSEANKHELMHYYYSFLSDSLISKSSFYFLIEKWKPDIIVDGINTATVVGYQDDPYSIPRSILNKSTQNWKEATEDLLVSNIIPSLIRFTQSLKVATEKFKVKSYVKVSTTGLGGMGNNLFYTHGDVNEPGMSSGILGKVAAAGVMHQLFWSLSHTPGFNIKVVVPAALVGWQGVNYGKFRSHGQNLPQVDSLKRIKLKIGSNFTTQETKKIAPFFEIPYVDSGENSAYSLGEMTAITALGQMESVTREEIAEACIGAIKGSTRHDLLTAMDMAALGPSFIGAVQRKVVLDKLEQFEQETGTKSIATNNLGPTVSKRLFELYLLMSVSDYSLKKGIEIDPKLITEKIEKLVMNDINIRSQIVSLGLPIIFTGNEAIIGSYYYTPNPKEKQKITEENINMWANSSWVDVRTSQIKYWQSILKKVYAENAILEKKNSIVLDRNWQHLNDDNVGELLGYIYSMMGGERKVEFN